MKRPREKKYLICPGHIRSQNDGQSHYVDATALRRLYNVPPEECIVLYPEGNPSDYPDLVPLYPRYDGNYTLPFPYNLSKETFDE